MFFKALDLFWKEWLVCHNVSDDSFTLLYSVPTTLWIEILNENPQKLCDNKTENPFILKDDE